MPRRKSRNGEGNHNGTAEKAANIELQKLEWEKEKYRRELADRERKRQHEMRLLQEQRKAQSHKENDLDELGRWGKTLKNMLPKMPKNGKDVSSWLRIVQSDFEKKQVPEKLWGTLMMPLLSGVGMSLISHLSPCEMGDFRVLKSELLKSFGMFDHDIYRKRPFNKPGEGNVVESTTLGREQKGEIRSGGDKMSTSGTAAGDDREFEVLCGTLGGNEANSEGVVTNAAQLVEPLRMERHLSGATSRDTQYISPKLPATKSAHDSLTSLRSDPSEDLVHRQLSRAEMRERKKTPDGSKPNDSSLLERKTKIFPTPSKTKKVKSVEEDFERNNSEVGKEVRQDLGSKKSPGEGTGDGSSARKPKVKTRTAKEVFQKKETGKSTKEIKAMKLVKQRENQKLVTGTDQNRASESSRVRDVRFQPIAETGENLKLKNNTSTCTTGQESNSSEQGNCSSGNVEKPVVRVHKERKAGGGGNASRPAIQVHEDRKAVSLGEQSPADSFTSAPVLSRMIGHNRQVVQESTCALDARWSAPPFVEDVASSTGNGLSEIKTTNATKAADETEKDDANFGAGPSICSSDAKISFQGDEEREKQDDEDEDTLLSKDDDEDSPLSVLKMKSSANSPLLDIIKCDDALKDALSVNTSIASVNGAEGTLEVSFTDDSLGFRIDGSKEGIKKGKAQRRKRGRDRGGTAVARGRDCGRGFAAVQEAWTDDGLLGKPMKRSRIQEQDVKMMSQFAAQLGEEQRKLESLVRQRMQKAATQAKDRKRKEVAAQEVLEKAANSKRKCRREKIEMHVQDLFTGKEEEKKKSGETEELHQKKRFKQRKRKRAKEKSCKSEGNSWDVSSESTTMSEEFEEEDSAEDNVEEKDEEFACEDLEDNSEPVILRRGRHIQARRRKVRERNKISSVSDVIIMSIPDEYLQDVNVRCMHKASLEPVQSLEWGGVKPRP